MYIYVHRRGVYICTVLVYPYTSYTALSYTAESQNDWIYRARERSRWTRGIQFMPLPTPRRISQLFSSSDTRNAHSLLERRSSAFDNDGFASSARYVNFHLATFWFGHRTRVNSNTNPFARKHNYSTTFPSLKFWTTNIAQETDNVSKLKTSKLRVKEIIRWCTNFAY